MLNIKCKFLFSIKKLGWSGKNNKKNLTDPTRRDSNVTFLQQGDRIGHIPSNTLLTNPLVCVSMYIEIEREEIFQLVRTWPRKQRPNPPCGVKRGLCGSLIVVDIMPRNYISKRKMVTRGVDLIKKTWNCGELFSNVVWHRTRRRVQKTDWVPSTSRWRTRNGTRIVFSFHK